MPTPHQSFDYDNAPKGNRSDPMADLATRLIAGRAADHREGMIVVIGTDTP